MDAYNCLANVFCLYDHVRKSKDRKNKETE
jgi:hypothetical protein